MNTNTQSTRGHKVMTRLTVAAVATLALTVQVVAPALAQSANDSFLPPEVLPLDPQVATQLSQAQAKARELNPVNRGLNVSADTMGDPANGSMMNTGASPMNSRSMRQDMMQSLTAPNNGAQFANMGDNQPQATTGTSDWIMPEQPSAQAGIATNFGNVEQTQTLTGQTQQQAVRHDTLRRGGSNAISAMAGFGAGAILGSVLRRPNSLMGLGMTGLMLNGFGTRNAFRF
ncbi:MAG: hypothetical protein JSS86_04630 [Cyanobacteria bacterium SZAS LIN-2]|nr:hypothetical protein [Cyanobacteria bacterium SZAS LIN-3]MBS1995569.1 hypothetical protein [Cyanobacteria bacterium SZAS LIN-2]MBS2010791.1 hypothetical protein [Cyanobacteria bacterium SZAS TMP-1]